MQEREKGELTMFENALIGVNDKNGKPIKNGDKVRCILDNREYLIVWEQEHCQFMLRPLNNKLKLDMPILAFTLTKYHEVVEGG